MYNDNDRGEDVKKKVVLGILIFFSFLFIVGCDGEDKKISDNNVSTRELTLNEKEYLLSIIEKIKYMDYYNKDIVIRDLTNQEILRLSYEILALEGNAVSGKLSFDELEKVALEYFDFSLEPENLICDTHYNIQDGSGSDIMIYNIDTGIYTNNAKHLGHGSGGLRTEVYNNFVSGYESDGIYTIVVNKIFSEVLGDTSGRKKKYYATYGDAFNYRNELFKSSMVDVNKFSLYKDSLVEYTYKFVLKNDNYVLVSYKIN